MMGSLFKKPRCECGRERVLSALGYTYRPCVCAPRPPKPKGPSDVSSLCIKPPIPQGPTPDIYDLLPRPSVPLRPTDQRLRETKREYVKLGKTWSFSDVEASRPGHDWELVQVLTMECGAYALWQRRADG